MIKRILIRFFIFLRKIRPLGFRGASLYDVLRFLFQSLFDPRFNLMASAIAFNFFLATIPCLIFLFVLLPYIPIKNFKQEILIYLATYTPVDSFSVIQKIVNASFHKVGVGLILLNIFLILRPSLRGILALMSAFKKTDTLNVKNNIFKMYGKAIAIFFLNLIFFFTAIIVLNGGIYLINRAIEYKIVFGFLQTSLLTLLNYVITFLLLVASISLLYLLGSTRKRKWGFFSPGSIFAASLLLLTLLGLNYYFSHFGSYNKIYGSLATVIIMMLWFYYIAIMLLLGDELNFAIDQAEKHDKRKTPQNQPLEILPIKKENRPIR